MVGWHHQFNGHEFEQILEDGEGQGSLVFCSPWGHKESDMTEHACAYAPGLRWRSYYHPWHPFDFSKTVRICEEEQFVEPGIDSY